MMENKIILFILFILSEFLSCTKNIVFANEDRLNGVDIASAVFGAGNSVTFDATGGPSNGGTVTLALGSKGGFTIVELLMVVLILGIVAMAGMPTLVSGLEGYRLSAAVTEIVTAIEYAQLTAMTAGGNTRITIDSSNNTILVEKFEPGQSLLGAETELDDTVVEGGSYVTMGNPINKGTDYQVSLASEDRSSGVNITTSTFGAGDFIIFDALGAPSDGGTVTLSLGSRQATLTVDSLTGKVASNI